MDRLKASQLHFTHLAYIPRTCRIGTLSGEVCRKRQSQECQNSSYREDSILVTPPSNEGEGLPLSPTESIELGETLFQTTTFLKYGLLLERPFTYDYSHTVALS